MGLAGAGKAEGQHVDAVCPASTVLAGLSSISFAGSLPQPWWRHPLTSLLILYDPISTHHFGNAASLEKPG